MFPHPTAVRQHVLHTNLHHGFFGLLVQHNDWVCPETLFAPALQVSVDISTSPSVFEAVEAAAVAHFKANPSDFSGEKMIIANLVGDPLKYMLCVWWEYAYPGKISADVATCVVIRGLV